MDDNILAKLEKIVSSDYVISDKESMADYIKDESTSFSTEKHYPDILIKPSTTDEISKVMKLANKYKIPVTPVGGKLHL